MRIVLGWVGAVVVLAASLVAGVAVANATVFSASGFVRDYLAALSDGRVDEALTLPGVDADGLDERMLDAVAMTAFDWRVLDERSAGGVHRVTVEFEAPGVSERATLHVERIGTRFGLFPAWGFAVSPVTALELTLSGDARFTVGGLPLALDDGGPVRFAILTPGVYVFAHESEFLAAGDTIVAATGGEQSVRVSVTPSAAFREAAQRALDEKLEACTAQPVLFPTGCPFGFGIQNRVASDPSWSIDRGPQMRLVRGEELGTWALTGSDGVAVLRVDVQSIFDGSVTSLEQEVPFSVSYRVGFEGDAVVLAPAEEPAD